MIGRKDEGWHVEFTVEHGRPSFVGVKYLDDDDFEIWEVTWEAYDLVEFRRAVGELRSLGVPTEWLTLLLPSPDQVVRAIHTGDCSLWEPCPSPPAGAAT